MAGLPTNSNTLAEKQAKTLRQWQELFDASCAADAPSAQKPRAVIDREMAFYSHEYATVHRGIHTLSANATSAMESVREQVARYINATSAEEIVFVRGTTEAINLVANSYGSAFIEAGDNILITEMEHHANIVPWQMLAERQGVELRARWAARCWSTVRRP